MKKVVLLLWLSMLLLPMALRAAEVAAEAKVVTKNVSDEDVKSERKHIILAFDGATKFRKESEDVKAEVINMLFGDEGLLREGDMLSVVCAAGNAERPSDPLVKVRFGWAEIKGDSVKKKLEREWNNYVKCDWISSDEVYSLLSITKPYIVDALGRSKVKSDVDRTLMLYVTDNVYNGANNYYEESLYFLNGLIAQGGNFYTSLDRLMSVCAKVSQEYTISYVKGRRKPMRNPWYAYFDLFELVHNHQSITLPAVLSHRPIIEAKRQAGGNYAFDFDIKAYNDHFAVLSVEAYGCDRIGGAEESSCNGVSDKLIFSRGEMSLGESDVISGEFHRSELYEALHLRSMVHINEDAYGATRFELNHEVEIVLEADATILFGKFELPDWIWFPWCDDQYEVAGWVDIFLVVLAIILFIIYVLCRRSYVPANGDISMGFYDVNNKNKE